MAVPSSSSSSSSSSSKDWVFTMNNYNENHKATMVGLSVNDKNDPDSISYLVAGEDIVTGTPHLQGFVSFVEKKHASEVLHMLGECNLEVSTDCTEAIDNCKSKGKYFEVGIPWSYLVPVPERYQARECEIETAKRAMTLKMLDDLMELMRKVLDAGYIIRDRITGEDVTVHTINLYHIDEHFVKPLTQKEQCSFVELAVSRQYMDEKEKEGISTAPTFFVSHWWGTPFKDTIRMLKLHSDRALTMKEQLSRREYSVWICAFANRQHNLNEELPSSNAYEETPFAQAIWSNKCRGTVLLLNEEGGEPLRRSWCIFEAFVSLTKCQKKKKRHRFDIATIIPEGTHTEDGKTNLRCAGLWSDLHSLSWSYRSVSRLGYMSTDHPDEKEPAGKGSCRPSVSIPLDLALKGLQVDIRQAEATQTEDQQRISEWVGGYAHEVNIALRRKFLSPALRSPCVLRDAESLSKALQLSRELLDVEEYQTTIQDLLLIHSLMYDEEADANLDGALDCVKVLLQNGWDANAEISREISRLMLGGDRPLGRALLIQENYSFARALLEGGADPEQLGLVQFRDVMEHYEKWPEDIQKIFFEKGLVRRHKRFRHLGICISCCQITHERMLLLNPYFLRDLLRAAMRVNEHG